MLKKRGVASISISLHWLAIWFYRGLEQKLEQRLVTHFKAQLSQQTRRASAFTTSNKVYQQNSSIRLNREERNRHERRRGKKDSVVSEKSGEIITRLRAQFAP